MSGPLVSFVVPCYRLAHLLAECLDSILSQSYTDIEVLVMDDQSPDDTGDVVGRYTDERVSYVRNEKNLGHLRNYNKGISLARGRYVWLISADDYLRSREIVAKYVAVMEENPHAGYALCPGYSVKDGIEGEMIGAYGGGDRVVRGSKFLHKLLDYNFVLAASVIVRRECYERLGMFPLDARWNEKPVDMGWLGDWYLWCLFALHYDVAYFAEPMVCYRDHGLSMTSRITQRDLVRKCAESDVRMLWMLRALCQREHLRTLERECIRAIAREYARQAAGKQYRCGVYRLSGTDFEASLSQSTHSADERRWLRARFYDGLGDRLVAQEKYDGGAHVYAASLIEDPFRVKGYLKWTLAAAGRPGAQARAAIARLLGRRNYPEAIGKSASGEPKTQQVDAVKA